MNTPAVVFAHYQIPQARLDDHFRWNDAFYRHSGAVVYVVTDHLRRVPMYGRCVILPKIALPKLEGETVFSLSLTKNRGIMAALGGRCDPIIVTDTDIAFSDAAWEEMVGVASNVASLPVYLMARSYDARSERDKPDTGMTGTIGMRAKHWRHVKFNETCVGYGAEDGIVHRAIRERGLVQLRDTFIWHIAHDEQHLHRTPGHGSADCWNRDTLNPDNFAANRRV
jgi:hypothetical protein